MNTLEEEQSDLFHMGKYSPLVQVLDIQKGYCLLKNLATYTDRKYAVAIILESGLPHMVMDTSEDCWLLYDQADEVMRAALNQKTYNKATQDFFNHDENY